MDFLSDEESHPTRDVFDIDAFKQEYHILSLIHYRSKNQHRVSYWWKYFEMMLQRCSQLVDEFEKASRQRDQEILKKKSKRKYDGRIPVWTQCKRIGQIAQFLYSQLIPSAHRNFHSMLAQAAFITLGMALLGATARIYRLITPIVAASKKGAEAARKRKARADRLLVQKEENVASQHRRLDKSKAPKTKLPISGELDLLEADIGESISREELQFLQQTKVEEVNVTCNPMGSLTSTSTSVSALEFTSAGVSSTSIKRPSPLLDLSEEPSRKTKKAKTKEPKKKKKTKKNAIDNIFGDF